MSTTTEKKIKPSVKINNRNRLRNRLYKNKLKCLYKKIQSIFALPNINQANEIVLERLIPQYSSQVMKNAKKNIISKQSAGRKQSKLHKQYKQICIKIKSTK